MRIGVDYRFLSGGVLTVNRGVGRYTQQQLREVIKLDSQNEYLLFCLPNADHSLVLPEILSAHNVSIVTIALSSERSKFDPGRSSPENILRFAEEYQSWIYQQNLDLYHSTIPFLWNDIIMPRFDACPMVATFYDVIPLVFPQHYLPPQSPTTELYARILNFVQNADHLVAISESARQDAIHYLGFQPDKIDIAYPIAEDWFRVIAPQEAQTLLKRIRQEIDLPDHFLMTVPHLHHSKNFSNLLLAFAKLPPAVRAELPLVAVCHMSTDEKTLVHKMAADCGVADDIRITGFVSDEEMVALYNSATIVIHASRYEGFGLPVLEAMQCGAPVITTTSSSLPEVGGDAAILVNPEDVQEIATAIETLYLAPERREQMKQLSIEQAKKFNPVALGRNTLTSYTKTLQSVHNRVSFEHPRIALWTPLPPQISGIADYSAELLKQLSCQYDIEVFVDDGYLPAPEILSEYKIQHYSAFTRRHTQNPFDTVIYQLGNSFFHLYMYEALQKHPGIVTVHDLAWINLLQANYARQGKMELFAQELEEMEGLAARQEYENLVRSAADTPTLFNFYSKYWMLERVIHSSLAIIVQSALENAELRRRYQTDKIHIVQMGVEDPWQNGQAYTLASARTQLGVSDATLLIGVFGIVHRIKRVDVCIKAFQILQRNYPNAKLMVVGENIDPEYQQELEALVSALQLESRVSFLGRVEESDFNRWLLASDVVVNLRYPSTKQISAIIIRAFAAGKPLVISDLPEWDFVPRDCSFRVAPDEREVEALAEHLVRLAVAPELRAQMSAAARATFEDGYRVQDMAARYQAIIEKVIGCPPGAGRFASYTDSDSSSPSRKPGFNKLCELEDFSAPEITALVRDLFQPEAHCLRPEFPGEIEHPKYWESAMSVRALSHHGVLQPEAVVLGICAETEIVPLYLTKLVKQVFVQALSSNSEAEEGHLLNFRLSGSDQVTPSNFETGHLFIQPATGYILPYPDSSFDGIFSLGLLENLGSLEAVAQAIREMERVLKPGGILALTTKYLISGPPASVGGSDYLLFSTENLNRYVANASSLELVDDLSTSLSEQTLTSKRDLIGAIESSGHPFRTQSRGKLKPLLTVYQGHVYCPIHLTLRKPMSYVSSPIHSRQAISIISKSQDVSALSRRKMKTQRLPEKWHIEVEQEIAAFAGQQADSHTKSEAQAEPWRKEIESKLGEISQQQYKNRERVENLGSQLENLAQDTKNLYYQLNARLRQDASYVRLVQQQLESDPRQAERSGKCPLDVSEVTELINYLEQCLPALRNCNAVDISIQGELGTALESTLFAAASLQGPRLSAQGEVYRSPNDAWYHIDFTKEWNRANLFESAAKRLAVSGAFILITLPEHDLNITPHHQLSLTINQIVGLTSGKQVRIHVYLKEDNSETNRENTQ